MFNTINLYNPDFIIECARLIYCRDIYESFRNNGITRSYVYGMCYKPSLLTYDFLKVGQSHPDLSINRKHQVGERIVRQMSWVPGWSGEHVRSSHGADFWFGIKDLLIPKGLLSPTFNKNDITIAVWDMSHRMLTSDICTHDSAKATDWAEGELARQYKNSFGRLPYLNIQDPSNTKSYKTGYTPKSIWNNLFDI